MFDQHPLLEGRYELPSQPWKYEKPSAQFVYASVNVDFLTGERAWSMSKPTLKPGFVFLIVLTAKKQHCTVDTSPHTFNPRPQIVSHRPE